MIEVGLACETEWHKASNEAFGARLAALPHTEQIRAFQKGAQYIPLSQRSAWLAGYGYEDHRGDLESWLHERAGTPFDYHYGKYADEAPRVWRVSTKPPRGTRKRIMAEIAERFSLSESAVDNLWQAYRRFVRDLNKEIDNNTES
jgi:hypothetical protein